MEHSKQEQEIYELAELLMQSEHLEASAIILRDFAEKCYQEGAIDAQNDADIEDLEKENDNLRAENKDLHFKNDVIENICAVRRSVLGALNGAKKNCLALKNTPHIESREYALAHGKLEGINKAIDIVKKYCV